MSLHLAHLERPTSAGGNFSYISFAASVLMVGGGVFALLTDGCAPILPWARGWWFCFTLAKTLRDIHEAGRMINRIEEARTENC